MGRAARTAIGLLAALAAAGCASTREAQLDRATRERLGQGPPIHVLHYVPKPLDYVRSPLERTDAFYAVPGVDDPVADVERALLDALRAELGLSNLSPAGRPIWVERDMLPRNVTWKRACAYGDPLTEWPAEWYRDGLVLELETLHWYVDGSGPKRIFGKCTLLYGLRATLVRLSDGTVLWRGFCQAEHPRPCSDLVADDLRLVKELRAQIASRCAAELTGSFMGRTETTFLGGLNQPKDGSR